MDGLAPGGGAGIAATAGGGVSFVGSAQRVAGIRREEKTYGDARGFPRGAVMDRFYFSRDEQTVTWRNPDGSPFLPQVDFSGTVNLETVGTGVYDPAPPQFRFEMRMHRYPVLRPGWQPDDPRLRPTLPVPESPVDPFPDQLLWRFGRTINPPPDYWRPLYWYAPEWITFRRNHYEAPQSEIFPGSTDPVRVDRMRILGPGGSSLGAPCSDLSAFSIHTVPLSPFYFVDAVTTIYVVDFASGQWRDASHVVTIAHDDPGTSPYPSVNGLVEVQVLQGTS